MFKQIFTKRDLAELYHRFLPEDARQYLNRRGIPDGIIRRQLLGWKGSRITIPIFGRDGHEVLMFRYAKSPRDQSDSRKMLSELGSWAELYGWETLMRKPHRVVICEGEFDRLVLEANGIPAVTSTAGAQVFLPHWAEYFADIRHVYICFDRDPAGWDGAEKVKRILPKAKIVELPAEVGDSGDVTDYFVRLGKNRVDFDLLLAAAEGKEDAETSPQEPPKIRTPRPGHKALARRAQTLKSRIPIEKIISLYIELKPSGRNLVGLCPFHEEKTPSFTVYPGSGKYYCFGCGAGGDLITFLTKKESMNFGQALEALESYLYTDELFRTS